MVWSWQYCSELQWFGQTSRHRYVLSRTWSLWGHCWISANVARCLQYGLVSHVGVEGISKRWRLQLHIIAFVFPCRLKCSCEQKFINCLQAVNSVISNTLGHIYYSARGKCLALGHPIMSCKQYQEGTFRKRCIRYNIDKRRSQVWQLYDMPFYTTVSK